ncbi:acyltransferase family protein [Xylophilus sp. ASV27]|uniref:acyltransferase family protein n=1 Tax=Xylophilus sp. ASV27 TaxID=2795129 RepID=UPI001E59ADA3|nr:acyltransferase [Xylophilus sp. ASV27]
MSAPANAQRMPLIDALKAVACVLIIWHHLAFYGPMSDVARPLAPALLDWLAEYARMAVHVFLVLGGFLAAASLAPEVRPRFERPLAQITRRYARLSAPYLAALCVSVLVAALVRPALHSPAVPPAPTLGQLLAHGLLVQDLAGEEGLSAGVWYVAIDFQLFALTVLLLALARPLQQRWPRHGTRIGAALVLVIAALSLAIFNRHAELDDTALYFFGSYGLGMLAWWAGRSRHPRHWIAAMLALGVAALALDWRGRLATALVTALVLAWAQRSEPLRHWQAHPALLRLGRMSYSVFLIHFPVCLLVAAWVGLRWPADPAANALGMLAAFLLSVVAGMALHYGVERRAASARMLAGLFAALLVCGWLVR